MATYDFPNSLVGRAMRDAEQTSKPNAFGDAAAAPQPGLARLGTQTGMQSSPAPSGSTGPLQRSVAGLAGATGPSPAMAGGGLMDRAFGASANTPSAATSMPGNPLVNRAFADATPSNAVKFDRASNTYSGGNVAGDISLNGNAPASSGLVSRAFASPQVPAAPKQSLIDRAFATQPGQQDIPQVQAPQVAHSGNDWEARNNLRNLEVSASSITNNGGRYDSRQGRANSGPSLAQAAFFEAQKADLAARNEQPGLVARAMEQQAALQREGMEQGGAQRRSLVQAAMEQQRNQNDLSRASMAEDGANQRAVLQTLGGIEEAQLRANAAKSPPPGYRSLTNGNLQAIPGGPADLSVSKEGQQQTKDTQDVFSILDQARPLLDTATGSYAGAAADQVARAFGVSTEGAQSAAQLKTLQGALVSKMPKMSGPQSDKDVLLYREMAGQIGDPTIPADQRRAAMKTVEDLNHKYLPVASDPATYQSLPSGSYFKTADGSVRRKQ